MSTKGREVYIQRKAGKVIGVFGCPQPQPDNTVLTDPAPLPEDHPDVVLFFSELGEAKP